MRSRTTAGFWKRYDQLPHDVQNHADETYGRWAADHNHPAVQFKKIKGRSVYSVRIGLEFRALGRVDGDTITWF
jgi:hypothetical protein